MVYLHMTQNHLVADITTWLHIASFAFTVTQAKKQFTAYTKNILHIQNSDLKN